VIDHPLDHQAGDDQRGRRMTRRVRLFVSHTSPVIRPLRFDTKSLTLIVEPIR
jgi:hypothetical protein